MASIPFIPDNAPFDPEQRAWLNGFLAGLYSEGAQSAVATPPARSSLKIGVFFATQSGTAERLAKKLAKELKTKGHTVELASLGAASTATLAQQEHALLLASTYGEGEPPDEIKGFREQLLDASAPRLDKLRYSVFALGDSNYEHFCQFGIEVDERLQNLGARRLTPRVESDVEVDEPFERWKSELLPRLEQNATEPTAKVVSISAPKTAEAVPLHTRDNPFMAELRERRDLTRDISSKLTVHLAFSLEDSPVHYEPGDACGVLAENDPALIKEILSTLPFTATSIVQIPKVGALTVEDALRQHLQPTRLTRKIVQAFAAQAGSQKLSGLLVPEQAVHLDEFMYDRGLIDLLHDFPGVITEPEQLVAMLPKLAPRLYSISSSPAAHGREVHATVAVVRYRSHNRERGGICSTMLADRTALGSQVPLYIHPNKKFRLPQSADTPMIMVGPGTGIAPFRSFLHERRALGATGENWLFFGERSAQTDFLYCEELRDLMNTGTLTRMDTAFSRDQAYKIYVQDRMIEQSADLWRWLERGAHFYVCGDASRMAKDVDAALHTVVEQHGGISPDAAKEYVAQLHDDRRYHRDVY
jgi:sulfite reductase (NADPH) flavoprotein alpha-component